MASKRYLLVVDNLDEAITFDDFEGIHLPPPYWKDSLRIISTTSQDVNNDIYLPGYRQYTKEVGEGDIAILIPYSLHQAAKYILRAIAHKDEKYWHHVAIRCFHYAMLLVPHDHDSSPHGDGGQQSSHGAFADITSDELIRQWAAQGIFTIDQERTDNTATASNQGKYSDIYQVGNVILEAFEEYSLLQLPFSPATKADEATKSAAHILACQDIIADAKHCRIDPDVQWISQVGTHERHLSREWLSLGASGPTTLIIRHCSQQSRLLINLESDHFLAKLPCLLVLDLSYTPIESLPPSILYLQKLRLLSLRGCYKLTSPFSFPDTKVALCQNNGYKKLNILYLDLSYSNINAFQCDFFQKVPNLKELLLVNCSNLEELLPSIAALSCLTKLELTANNSLLSLPALTEIALDGHPTLSSFSLIGVPCIRRVTLRGCGKLESVEIKEVDALEELDLSTTAIKELPENIPNLPVLRLLLLVGIPSLRRFPWHKLQRFPDVFCLDQCSSRTITNHSAPQVAQVCVSDSRLFYSFNVHTRDLVNAGKLLRSFYVRVTSSCKTTTRKIHDAEEDRVTTNKLQVPTTYADVNRFYLTDGIYMVSMDDVPPFQVSERHVEISAADRYPHGLNYLPDVSKSIRMWDDAHVSCLSDLGYFSTLEQCMVQWCHQMVYVLKYSRNLKFACIFHLKSLTHFSVESGRFCALKHLVLEDCPRLEGVMPHHYCELQSLETLDIRFCYNLKAIFYGNSNSSSRTSNYLLPCLRRIRLQELPQLEHLHVSNPILSAPAWEELHVRGCWSLCRLPRLCQQVKAVKVSGEQAWWDKLCWDGTHSHIGSYKPMLPPAFASHRERVVIESYLR